MSTDQRFITNKQGEKLIDRFKDLIKDTQLFDVIVGYFYASGFHAIYKELEKTEKIRILIGVGLGEDVYEMMKKSRELSQSGFDFSHAKLKEKVGQNVIKEVTKSEDKKEVEEGILKFMEWLQSGKMEIKAYPTKRLHAKVYITTFKKGDRDEGRVITGSSNFSKSGLVDNLEFNCELDKADYKFAKKRFKELWDQAVDVSEEYVNTIQKKTWVNKDLTPYDLYLKFLYEYFQDDLDASDELDDQYTPNNFMKLEYQDQAVINAKKILEEYGGVFISDVVGLGKTYISARLANQLNGRNLVIAPPVLLDKDNPGSWPSVFSSFNVNYDVESLAPVKLEKLLKRGVDKYKNIFIDEAHRFRTESTVSYEKLAEVCRGKRVILVSATPFNNSPKDILSQLKLFQSARNSNIPGVPDIQSFFGRLERRVNKLDRRKDRQEYISTVENNAQQIREKVLKHVMVRRTRGEIEKYFGDDLEKQGLEFPEVAEPGSLFYELDENESNAFNRTQELITSKFKYARYTPLLYYKEGIEAQEETAQRNVGKFMKILLIKRLESSFYAFRQTIDRFIDSYEKVVELYDQGSVWIGKRKADRIFELIENDDEEEIHKLIEEDKVEKISAKDIKDGYREDLVKDIEILKEIKELWGKVDRDPKLLKLNEELKSNDVLKDNNLIVFTESKETAEYVKENIEDEFDDKVLLYTGSSAKGVREKVTENFDADTQYPKDDYRILICTEVLAEGINLHQANVVVNYDIPWNPTRLMQRAGRINRVNTKHKKIYTFTFFPTDQSNSEIKLKEAAISKIQAFIEMLGNDAKLLTDGEEVKSHDLFNRLTSKETVIGEDDEDSELKYLKSIKDIRDKKPDLFARVKSLPMKARTGRKKEDKSEELLTYFQKGKLKKFYLTNSNKAKELDFMTAASIMSAKKEEKRKKIDKENYYSLLDKNKQEFKQATKEDVPQKKPRGRDNSARILRILNAIKDYRQLTDSQEERYKKYIERLESGAIPKKTTKETYEQLNEKIKINNPDPLAVLKILDNNIPSRFLEEHLKENAAQTQGPRKVILSEYFNK